MLSLVYDKQSAVQRATAELRLKRLMIREKVQHSKVENIHIKAAEQILTCGISGC